jgi:hypothetical protein
LIFASVIPLRLRLEKTDPGEQRTAKGISRYLTITMVKWRKLVGAAQTRASSKGILAM